MVRAEFDAEDYSDMRVVNVIWGAEESFLREEIKRLYQRIVALDNIQERAQSKVRKTKQLDKEFEKIESIICSMTKAERKNPRILNGSRRLRIAKGSGTTVQEINKFMNSFEMTQKMMKKMQSNKGGMKNMLKNMDIDSLKNIKM